MTVRSALMPKLVGLCCLILVASLLAGCGGGGGGSSIARLEISPASGNLIAGADYQFTATAYDSEDNPVSVNPDWSVTGGIGTIDGEGLLSVTTTTSTDDPVTGTVVATVGSKVAVANVTVVVGAIADIVILPPENRDVNAIPAGAQVQFEAAGVDEFGNRGEETRIVLPGTVTWDVIGSIGDIDSNGLFTAALGAGVSSASGKITADWSTYHTELDVTVTSSAWTFLVYLDGDNSLDSYASMDMQEMEYGLAQGEGPVNVIVQWDRIGDTGTWRYEVQPDTNLSVLNSTLVQTMAEQNMGSPTTLANFITWGKENYPAENYCLVLWDHGSGWDYRTVQEIPVRAICQDSTNGGDWLNLPELKSALATAGDVEILDMDACVMGFAEVCYAMKDYAEYAVVSEDEVPAYGLPYDTVIEWMLDNPTATPEQLASAIVDLYADSYNPGASNRTLSAIDLSQMTSLASAVDQLANALIARFPNDQGSMAAALQGAEDFNTSTATCDLYDLADKLETISDAGVQSALDNVRSAVSNAVINEIHSTFDSIDAEGLALYVLNNGSAYNDDYDLLDWSSATHWDEFLQLTNWQSQF